MHISSRRRWVAPAMLTVYFVACASVGYTAEWRQPNGTLRWTWTLTYFGIPLACLVVSVFQRRVMWSITCAIAGSVLWLVGYAMLWRGDPRRDIFVYIATVAVATPVLILNGIAAIIAMVAAGRADVRSSTAIPPHCVGCGYDLTGNTSGRCPECGAEIEPSQRAGPSSRER